MNHQGYTIGPKTDFPPNGYCIRGEWVKTGFIITKDGKNVMENKGWFLTVERAKIAIHALIQEAKPVPTIVEPEHMSPFMAKHWNTKAEELRGVVDLIDPWRKPLEELRKRFPGKSVYRAAMVGRHGRTEYIEKL